MNTLSIQQIIADSVNGSSFISIDTVTTPKLLGGKKNPFNGITRKVTIGSNVMVFQNKKINGYDAMVKRRLVEEGKDPKSFTLSPRKWGERVKDTPFITHKGETYLEVIFLSPGNTHYEVNGTPTPKKDIQGLPKPSVPKQGGLEDKVIIRTFKMSSISSITINKKTYNLR